MESHRVCSYALLTALAAFTEVGARGETISLGNAAPTTIRVEFENGTIQELGEPATRGRVMPRSNASGDWTLNVRGNILRPVPGGFGETVLLDFDAPTSGPYRVAEFIIMNDEWDDSAGELVELFHNDAADPFFSFRAGTTLLPGELPGEGWNTPQDILSPDATSVVLVNNDVAMMAGPNSIRARIVGGDFPGIEPDVMTLTAVPEPSTAILGVGGIGFALLVSFISRRVR